MESWMNNAGSDITFFVNGVKVVERHPHPDMTLLYYLRNNLGLTGTKLGCGEGGCGACTVMVSQYDPVNQKISHYSINACLSLLCSMDGLVVTTVEGIGKLGSLHPVQERIAKSHGSQCGFCTPGIVMSMYTLLRNNPLPTQGEMERAFDGNLCRCTGYRAILDGYKTFTKEFCCGGQSCGGKKCCKDEGTGIISGSFVLFDPSEFKPLDPTQEPIFPPELQVRGPPQPLFIKGPLSEWSHDGEIRSHQTVWIRPVTLDQLLDAKNTYPKAKIVVGSSEISVEMKVRGWEYSVFISPMCVSELTEMRETPEGLSVGASCSLNQVAEKIRELVDRFPKYKTQTFQAVLEMLRWFAGDQVRNVASVGGNLMTASPISDLNPILMAVGATVTIASKTGGHRIAVVDEKFFVSYRKVAMETNEVLISILIPYNKQSEHILAYKQARRREDDIAIVNAAFMVELGAKDNKEIVRSSRLVFGGRAPVTKVAQQTQQAIIGMPWDNSLLEEALRLIPLDLPASSDVPGGMPQYRQTLSMSFFYKFFMTVLGRVASSSLPTTEANITDPFTHILTKSSQGFQDVPLSQSKEDVIGRPIPHLSATKQSSGVAVYVDDMPKYKGELYGGIVWSSRAHARVVQVDASEAVKIPGVWGFVGARDIEGNESNTFALGGVMGEVVFAEEVTCRGQIIGIVLADDQIIAQRAARRVNVTYEELPSTLTMQVIMEKSWFEEAIETKSFYDIQCEIKTGSVEVGFDQSDHIVTGELHIGGQEHFYLETNAILVVPKEDGEMEIFNSTQSAHLTQIQIAKVTGIPSNKIVVRVKRMGGGFGGKETRSVPFSCAVAIAAKKCGRPVRVMLDRHEDMISTGTRHPFLAKYKVGCTKDGRITSACVELYSNGGNTLDLSMRVLEKAVCQIDNCYNIPNWHVIGRICKTNIPSSTAFRGFGGPQGMLVAEAFIEKVAQVCGLEPTEVRRLNLYQEGDLTPYKQILVDCHLQQCWDELTKKADITERRRAIDNFNCKSRWIKRGLSVVPTKFGIAFDSFLNQGGALVHVYSDGAVLLTHGGTEMGQGLHTKMVQVCARALGIPPSKVHITEMATNTVPNASPTAASFSTDLYGMAVKNACEQIKERLSPYMEAKPKGKWEEWVQTAYLDRVNLSANGFYKSEELIEMDWVKGEGSPFSYFTYGVACSEVEVDLLTGDHKVLRTDIVMDVGESLNPAIDIGQVEGGFAQGYGLFMMEEHVFLDGNEKMRGTMVTTGPGAYKIPGFSDIPVEFNVSLLKGVPNKRAIYSSKAIGEPPLFLASSVFFAVRDAIAASRKEAGVSADFRLDSPATCERIRMACADKMVQAGCDNVKDTGKKWNIVV